MFRSDGSGTTYGFIHYLSKISPAWKNEVGYATSVGFPAGVGAKGNSGVTSTVTKTPGAIGYIEASYIIAAGLEGCCGPEQGRQLRVAEPDKHRKQRRRWSRACPPTTNSAITNPPKKATMAYPISTFTYAIVPHNAPQKGFSPAVRQLRVTNGQKYGAALDFAPLPKVVLRRVESAIASL